MPRPIYSFQESFAAGVTVARGMLGKMIIVIINEIYYTSFIEDIIIFFILFTDSYLDHC